MPRAAPQDTADATDARAALGELRTEVGRLAAELEAVRAHAAALESLAHEDALTGLLNRRGFLRDLTRAIAYRGRYGTGAALLLADLDRFKPINDTHGHAVGDGALKHVAAVLRQHIRASDTLARIGGDEFALIIWQVDEATARQKADALQAIVAATPLAVAGTELALGCSIGVAMLESEDAPERALARADAAMYARKGARGTRRA